MAITIATWIYITFVSFILGFSWNAFWKKISGFSMESIEMYLLTGLCICTIYAQIFSLFAGVGLYANIILFLFVLPAAWFSRKSIQNFFQTVQHPLAAPSLLISVGIILLFALFSAQAPTHIDTYLYHAQAIHWIEDYGLVPGLGNLHKRFAYNSSFLVLQALFSFKFLCKVSLHSLNGYVAVLFSLYSILSFKLFKRKKLYVSDGLRLILLLYIAHIFYWVSSPMTDPFVLMLAAYIFIKWCDYSEEGMCSTDQGGWLCLMTIFACTLKLSSAFMLVLLIKPVYMLLRKRLWKKLGYYILFSAFIALPFVARNVMICGYLLYPYAQLDLIPFIDWKMSPEALEYDKKEIIVWGRTTYDVATYGQPVTQWLPVWFQNQAAYVKLCFCAAVASSVGILASLYTWLRKKEYDLLLLGISAISCLLGWMATAPLIRYGEIFILLPTCIFVLSLAQKIVPLQKAGKLGILLGSIFILAVTLTEIIPFPNIPVLLSEDYEKTACTESELDGIMIYAAEEKQLSGYHAFPATVSKAILEEIELRGSSLKKGFRLKNIP